MEERLFILWATSREWADYSTAMQLHAKPDTVRRYRDAIFEHPSLILSLPVAKQIGKREWLCRLCRDSRASYLPDEIARSVSLEGVGEPL